MENIEFSEIADTLYERIFPATIILCAVIGTLSFAFHSYPQAIVAFIAVAAGILVNGVVERRRQENAERLACLGWTRTRLPSKL